MSDAIRRHVYAIVILVLLIVSVPYDLRTSLLPFYRFWGVDFQNLHAFHHCEVRNHPYDHPDAARICLDAENRPMRYPPLLYWSFVWTRAFSFATALHIWTIVILIGTYLGITLFLRSVDLAKREIQLFIGLLFVQFPALYALERGNNDVWIVLLWGLAYWQAARSRWFVAGALVGVATMAKVYPAFAVLVVMIGLFQDRRALLRFAAGAAAAVVAVCLLFFRSTLTYVSVLRTFAAEEQIPSLSAHGLPAFFAPLAAFVFAGSLFLFWSAAAHRLYRARRLDLMFAGALSIATFFATTSNDYNLITTYPLLAILFVRSFEPKQTLTRIALVALLLTVTGPRILFLGNPHQHVALMVLALLLAAGAGLRPEPRRDGTIAAHA